MSSAQPPQSQDLQTRSCGLVARPRPCASCLGLCTATCSCLRRRGTVRGLRWLPLRVGERRYFTDCLALGLHAPTQGHELTWSCRHVCMGMGMGMGRGHPPQRGAHVLQGAEPGHWGPQRFVAGEQNQKWPTSGPSGYITPASWGFPTLLSEGCNQKWSVPAVPSLAVPRSWPRERKFGTSVSLCGPRP